MWDSVHKPLFYKPLFYTCICIIALINSPAFSFFYTFIATSLTKQKYTCQFSFGREYMSVSFFFRRCAVSLKDEFKNKK